MPSLLAVGVELAERGWLPDQVLRHAIRRQLRERLDEASDGAAALDLEKRALAERLARGQVALATREANTQHYEVPAEFFRHVLGPHLKYSCAWFGDTPAPQPLAQAESDMLALTASRAGLEDGMRILDLGCGWGSFSLWAAQQLPRAQILAVSNSKGQREYILGRCRERGITNLDVQTQDVNRFEAPERFDRVVSVEMFEHMRNWQSLLAKIRSWLTPEGRLFVHHFCHRERAYPYEDRGESDWMARHFFTGGLMPSEDWLEHHDRDLAVEQAWRVDGRHYAFTSEAWLQRLDAEKIAVIESLLEAGETDPERATRRWRLFFLACAELFAHADGGEWFVRHALLAPTPTK